MSLQRFDLVELKRAHRWRIIGPNRADDYNTLADSCFCLSPSNPIRLALIHLIDNVYFDRVILFLIFFNSVTLALSDPALAHNDVVQDFLSVTEYIFLAVFTIEAVLKSLARGFVLHEHSYLRNPWNILDFFIVIVGLIQLTSQLCCSQSGDANLTVLRALRICRPLRTISRVKKMQVLLATLFNSIPLLLNSFFLLLFLVFVFSIMGVQLFMGGHHHRCYVDPGFNLSDRFPSIQTANPDCEAAIYGFGDVSRAPACHCMNSDYYVGQVSEMVNGSRILTAPWLACNSWSSVCGSSSCPEDMTCRVDLDSFNQGHLTFDDVPEAALLVLKIASLDDWPLDQLQLQQRAGHHAWIFFFFLTVLGNYFVFNLVLAILSSAFSSANREYSSRKRGVLSFMKASHVLGACLVHPALSLAVNEPWDDEERWRTDTPPASLFALAAKQARLRQQIPLTMLKQPPWWPSSDDPGKAGVFPSRDEFPYNLCTLAHLKELVDNQSASEGLDLGAAQLDGAELVGGNDATINVMNEEAVVQLCFFSQQRGAYVMTIGYSVGSDVAEPPVVEVEVQEERVATVDFTPSQKEVSIPVQLETGNNYISMVAHGAEESPFSITRLEMSMTALDTTLGTLCKHLEREMVGPFSLCTVEGRKARAQWCEQMLASYQDKTRVAGLDIHESMQRVATEFAVISIRAIIDEAVGTRSLSQVREWVRRRVSKVGMKDLVRDAFTAYDTQRDKELDLVDALVFFQHFHRKFMEVVLRQLQLIEKQLDAVDDKVSAVVQELRHKAHRAREVEHARISALFKLCDVGGGEEVEVDNKLTLEEVQHLLAGPKVWETIKLLDPRSSHQNLDQLNMLVDTAQQDGDDIDVGRRRGSLVDATGAAQTPEAEKRVMSKTRRRFVEFVEHPIFTTEMMFLTCYNVAALAVDKYPEDKRANDFVDTSNFICSIGFIVEAVLKLMAYHFSYFHDPYNCFDFLLVLVSLPEFVLSDSGIGAFTVLRAFRILRGFRMLKTVPALRRLIVTVLASVRSVGFLSLLILLYIYIFAVLGMTLFGGDGSDSARFQLHPEDDYFPRLSFTSFWESCLTIFVLMTGEGWGTLMKLAMEKHSAWGALYFVANFFIGTCILLNLFIAIVIEAISTNGATDEEEEMEEDDYFDELPNPPLDPVLRHSSIRSAGTRGNESASRGVVDGYTEPDDVASQPDFDNLRGSDVSDVDEESPDVVWVSCLAKDWAGMNGKYVKHPQQPRYYQVSCLCDDSEEIATSAYTGAHVGNCVWAEQPSSAEWVCLRDQYPVGDPRRPTDNPRWPYQATIFLSDLEGAAENRWRLSNDENFQTWWMSSAGLVGQWRDEGAYINQVWFNAHGDAPRSLVGTKCETPYPLVTTEKPDAGLMSSPRVSCRVLHRFKSRFHKNIEAALTTSRRPREPTRENTFSTPSRQLGLRRRVKSKPGKQPEPRSGPRSSVVTVEKPLKRKGSRRKTTARVAWEFSAHPAHGVPWWRALCEDMEVQREKLKGKSLGFLPAHGKVRQRLLKVVEHPVFANTVTFLIICNVVVIAMDTPEVQDEHLDLSRVLLKIDIAFAVVFLLECAIKIVTYGWWEYVQDKWNAVDFLVAWLALVAIFERTLKPFRSLRTVRLIVRLPEVRLIMESLFRVLPQVADTVLLLVAFMFVWAILGVSLFKGRYYSCNDPSIRTEAECVGEYTANQSDPFGPVPVAVNRSWEPFDPGFDNVGVAMLSLFQMAIGDGWAVPMYQGIDVQGIGEGPSRNNRPYSALYFISFIVFGQFFLLNLFIGLLIEGFISQKEELKQAKGVNFSDLVAPAKAWLQTRELAMRERMPQRERSPPKNFIALMCYRIATGEWPVKVTLSNNKDLPHLTYPPPDEYTDNPSLHPEVVRMADHIRGWTNSEEKFFNVPLELQSSGYLVRLPKRVNNTDNPLVPEGTEITINVSQTALIYVIVVPPRSPPRPDTRSAAVCCALVVWSLAAVALVESLLHPPSAAPTDDEEEENDDLQQAVVASRRGGVVKHWDVARRETKVRPVDALAMHLQTGGSLEGEWQAAYWWTSSPADTDTLTDTPNSFCVMRDDLGWLQWTEGTPISPTEPLENGTPRTRRGSVYSTPMRLVPNQLRVEAHALRLQVEGVYTLTTEKAEGFPVWSMTIHGCEMRLMSHEGDWVVMRADGQILLTSSPHRGRPPFRVYTCYNPLDVVWQYSATHRNREVLEESLVPVVTASQTMDNECLARAGTVHWVTLRESAATPMVMVAGEPSGSIPSLLVRYSAGGGNGTTSYVRAIPSWEGSEDLVGFSTITTALAVTTALYLHITSSNRETDGGYCTNLPRSGWLEAKKAPVYASPYPNYQYSSTPYNVTKVFSKTTSSRVFSIRGDSALTLPPTETKDATLAIVVVPQREEMSRFDLFTTLCIVLNAITLAMTHYSQSQAITDFLQVANLFFVIVFALEALIKIIGLGVREYFRDSWNKFDFVIVVVSILGLFSFFQKGFSAVRLFRVGRLLRLIKRARSLRTLFDTLVGSLPQLTNVALLLLVVFFMFGAVGVEVFGRINIDASEGLDRYTNFKNVYYALVTLYQISSTEGWIDVMDGTYKVNEEICSRDTTASGKSTCGVAKPVSLVFFLLFMVIGSCLIINMFVTVVVSAYEDSQLAAERMEYLDKLKEFTSSWERHDPRGRCYLPAKRCFDILQKLDENLWHINYAAIEAGKKALEMGHQNASASTDFQEKLKQLREMNIPLCKKGDVLEVRYIDVVSALIAKAINSSPPPDDIEDWPSLTDEQIVIASKFSKDELYSKYDPMTGMVAKNARYQLSHWLAMHKIEMWWHKYLSKRYGFGVEAALGPHMTAATMRRLSRIPGPDSSSSSSIYSLEPPREEYMGCTEPFSDRILRKAHDQSSTDGLDRDEEVIP